MPVPAAATAFSPLTAAFEGVRVMRREPKVVLSWVLIWLLVPVVFAIIVVVTASADGIPKPTGGHGYPNLNVAAKRP